MNIWHVSVESIAMEISVRGRCHSGINSELVEVVGYEEYFVQKSVLIYTSLSDSFNVSLAINTSLLTFTSEMIVISLEKIPVIVIQIGNIVNRAFTFRDNNSLIFLNSSHDNIEGDNSLSVGKSFLERTEISLASEGVSCSNSNIRETSQNFSHNVEVFFNSFWNSSVSGIQGEGVLVGG